MKMKVLFFGLMFLMLVANVVAMDDPIRVKARAGEEVRIFIWPAEYGPAINSDKGMTDVEGYFTSKIFFSLNSDNFTIQVGVFDSEGDKMGIGDFKGMNSLSPIFIDCGSRECELSSWVVEEEVENETVIVVDNETIEVAEVVESQRDDSGEPNETVIVVDNETVEDKEEDNYFTLTGKAIFLNEDGSFNWGYSIGGGVLLMFMFVFVFMMIHRGKNNDGFDGDDKELMYMEKKLKNTEDKIKKLKDHEVKKKKLEASRVRLAADERELEELENKKDLVKTGEAKVEKQVEKQEDVVEKDEQEVKEEENRASDNQDN